MRDRYDRILVNGQVHDAVYFHLPEERDGYLSNWYLSAFDLDGITFSSSEQYIMYRKCQLFGDSVSAAAVLATDDPAKQQAIGRNAGGFNGRAWDGMKQLFAFRGVLAKFSQNPDLARQLLDTGDAYLVECARSDTIWACGFRPDEDGRLDMGKWRGQNLLGFLLMEVRRILQSNR